MAQAPPVVLTIAGFDPSSGAGVTADIKTIAAHGCYGVACITALTVQSTAGVRRLETVNAELVAETLTELSADLDIASVRVGMLGSAKVTRAVADFLGRKKLENVVLDPILKATSGAALIDLAVTNPNQMRAAANKLHQMGAVAVVVTGGHLEKAIDLLSFKTRRSVEQEIFKSDRQRSNSTHGTGCAFATAIACHLAQGRGLPEAVLLAKAYITAAIVNAHPLGRGTGPVHHLYRMYQQRRVVIADPEPVN